MTTRRIITVREAGSTNTLLRQMLASGEAGQSDHGLMLSAVSQTAGRGQRGNSWEAAPGLNITVSMLICPEAIAASGQFAVSEVVALASARTVASLLPPAVAAKVSIKWPNDIYVADRKIGGILIENSLCGSRILYSVCGIGLNINQPAFVSDAPNPVSVLQLTGRPAPLDLALASLYDSILAPADRYLRPGGGGDTADLHREYMSMLWRREGCHPYVDADSGLRFEAAVDAVAPDGHLTLRLADGSRRTYAFKEVAAIID